MKGLYSYTRQEAARWGDAFARFTKDIYELASRYPASVLETEVKGNLVDRS